MDKKRNFLLLAIGVGIVGVIIGGVSIWLAAKDFLSP